MSSLLCCRATAHVRLLSAGASRRLSTSSTSTARHGPSAAKSGGIRLCSLALAGLLGSSGTAYLYLQKPVRADAGGDDVQMSSRRQTPLSTLLRTYVVYSLCCVPALVDWSPSILSMLSAVPGLRQISEALVRVTFFSQFVGGDTALDTVALLEEFRAENKGALFAYSVEVDELEAAGKKPKTSGSAPAKAVRPVHKQIVDEMIHCIDVAADFEDQRRTVKDEMTGRRTWVAIKLTALLPDARALTNLSSYLVKSRPSLPQPICFPGCPRPSDFDVLDMQDPLDLPETCPLTKDDIIALRELKDDLFKICKRAKERGVRIIVDAEHSWYQLAIDAYQFALMREFNRLPSHPSPFARLISTILSTSSASEQNGGLVQPLVYGTFQAYLRRTPDHLAQSFRDAERDNFALGVKLVRGAYHPFEVSAHGQGMHETSTGQIPRSLSISPDPLPPVWLSKAETDACYNACARMLIGRVRDDVQGGKREQGCVRIPKVGVLFGTHNWGSCQVILDELVNVGLAGQKHKGVSEVVNIGDDVAERVTLAQLYGMSDALTNSLVDRTRSTYPFVIKYVPYGALSEVMPYLGRRAIENKSVLGNGAAAEERRRAGSDIARRIYSFFG